MAHDECGDLERRSFPPPLLSPASQKHMNPHWIKRNTLLSSFALLMMLIPVSADDDGRGHRLTALTYIGSHNSYKKALHPKLMKWLRRFDARAADALDYQHPPLTTQLDLGLRLFELDVFYDPKGGLYQDPLGDAWLFRDQSFAEQHRQALQAPGFKVLHAQDIDFRSHCLTLAQCLTEMARFSTANPNHIPIVVTFNLKAQAIDLPGFTEPRPFDQTAFQALQRTMIDDLGLTRIFRPTELKGQWPTLAAAVENQGWPSIEQLRGKFLLVLDESEETLSPYNELSATSAPILFFKTPPLGHPDAAILILNDPIQQAEAIEQGVKKGYLVRTRADADTAEARGNDATRRDAAFASGAQLISTDYYLPDARYDGDYEVRFNNGGYVRQGPPRQAAGVTP